MFYRWDLKGRLTLTILLTQNNFENWIIWSSLELSSFAFSFYSIPIWLGTQMILIELPAESQVIACYHNLMQWYLVLAWCIALIAAWLATKSSWDLSRLIATFVRVLTEHTLHTCDDFKNYVGIFLNSSRNVSVVIIFSKYRSIWLVSILTTLTHFC